MCKLKKVTIDYVPVEDRVRLSGECEQGGQLAIWLTRRLLDRLLPVLLDWIEQHAADVPGTATRAETGAPNRRLPRAEPLQGFAQHAARQHLVPQAPVRPGADDASWLAAAVDVKRGRQGVRLALRGARREQRADLQLQVKVLRNWLNILHDSYRKADWPLDVWPDWVREAATPTPAVVRH